MVHFFCATIYSNISRFYVLGFYGYQECVYDVINTWRQLITVAVVCSMFHLYCVNIWCKTQTYLTVGYCWFIA